MGGDVFGNGLIHSKAFKLVAAFNHKHIFLDPNPDLEKALKKEKDYSIRNPLVGIIIILRFCPKAAAYS